MREEDHKFEDSLGYIARPCLKGRNKGRKKGRGRKRLASISQTSQSSQHWQMGDRERKLMFIACLVYAIMDNTHSSFKASLKHCLLMCTSSLPSSLLPFLPFPEMTLHFTFLLCS
jgi:hypothetical protein